MLKKIFLPAGIPLALLAGWFWPGIGQMLKMTGYIPFSIILIFFINGYGIDMKVKILKKKFSRALITGLIISLVSFPFLAMFILSRTALDPLLRSGLLVMSAMPPTISSAIVISNLGGGDKTWAVLLTVAYNLIGIFIIPQTLGISMSSSSDIAIPVMTTFRKLLALVLLPSVAGIAGRRIIRKNLPVWTDYLPSICVLLMVFAFVGNAHNTFRSFEATTLPLILLLASLLHIALLLINIIAAKILDLDAMQSCSYIIVSSQKTLPLSLTVLAIIFDDPGTAIVSCIIFYFFQLIFDSFLASRMHTILRYFRIA